MNSSPRIKCRHASGVVIEMDGGKYMINHVTNDMEGVCDVYAVWVPRGTTAWNGKLIDNRSLPHNEKEMFLKALHEKKKKDDKEITTDEQKDDLKVLHEWKEDAMGFGLFD